MDECNSLSGDPARGVFRWLPARKAVKFSCLSREHQVIAQETIRNKKPQAEKHLLEVIKKNNNDPEKLITNPTPDEQESLDILYSLFREQDTQASKAISGFFARKQKQKINTILRNAADAGRIEDVRHTLALGGYVNQPDINRNTALMEAAYEGHTEIVKALLDAGANVNCATSIARSTALIQASVQGHTGIVKALLGAGADVDHANIARNTALTWATEKGHEEIVNILLDAGAKVNGNKMTEQQLADLRASTTNIIATLKDLFKIETVTRPN